MDLPRVSLYDPNTDSDIAIDSSGNLSVVLAGSSDSYYLSERLEYDVNNLPIYRGRHTTLDAATSDTGWLIDKYEYTGTNMTYHRVRTGSWDGRTAGWA